MVLTVVGADAANGNRLLELVRSSVPARNRLIPSSWLTEKSSAVATVNVNSKTVASAKFPDAQDDSCARSITGRRSWRGGTVRGKEAADRIDSRIIVVDRRRERGARRNQRKRASE